jgi:peptidoglycan/LPS O-acetylase OafA/YrhL
VGGVLSSSKPSENSFNAVRLIAALQVAYIHAIANLHLTPTFGYLWIAQFPGVPIFFALSGYLVFDSLLRLQSVKQFARHRAARIYPALIVNVAIMEIAIFAAGQVSFRGSFQFVRGLAFYLVYVATASMDLANRWVGSGGGVHSFDGTFQIYPSGVLWTLTVEISFYVMMPLFLLTKTRAARTGLTVFLSFLSFAYQKNAGEAIITGDYWPQSVSVIPYFWMFGIGMIFRLWPPPQWAGKFGVPGLLIAFCILADSRALVWFEWKVAPTTSASVQSVLLCLLAVWLGYSPILKSKWLAKNDTSYGLYLYHMLIVTALMNVPQEHRTQWLLLVVIVGGVLIGFLSWHLIELPVMKLVRRNRPSDRTRSDVAERPNQQVN